MKTPITVDKAVSKSALPFVGRMLPLLMLLWLLQLALPAALRAQAEDYIYEIDTYRNTVTITGYTGLGRAVTIPSTIEDKPVTDIRNQAFQNCTSLTSVIIPDSVTSVGYMAFYNCTGLTNVAIGSGVSYIGFATFSGCVGLVAITVNAANTSFSTLDGVLFNKYKTSLLVHPAAKAGSSYTIPAGVTKIEDQAFLGCTHLTGVTIAASVTSIKGAAFYGCTSLASITIPAGLSLIAADAFNHCVSLNAITVNAANTKFSSVDGVWFDKLQTSLIQYPAAKAASEYTIPGTVTTIANRAFEYCSNLTGVTIGNSVISIGIQAFHSSSKLASVTFGSNVTSILSEAFDACPSLVSLIIPNSVTSIENYAFRDNTSLTGVYFQGNAPSVGYNVFDGANLATIYHPPGATGWPTVPNLWADRPTALTPSPVPYTYTIDGGVVTITKYTGSGGAVIVPSTIEDKPVSGLAWEAFAFCTGLTSVTIPDSVASIGNYVFNGCSGLTNVMIGAGVTSIGVSVFQSCTSLTTISVAGGNAVYSSAAGVLFNKTQTTLMQYPRAKAGSYTIPASVTSIGIDAFYGCSGLTGVTIAASVTSIGDSAFNSCTGLTNVTIPGNVISIGSYAFNGCRGLAGITLGAGVTSIGSSAFTGCTSLTAITVDSGNSVYSSAAGVLCDKHQTTVIQCPRGKTGSYTVPVGVTSIAAGAFRDCGGLTGVTLGALVASIGSSAFNGCSGLTNVTIPASATGIANYAFFNCGRMTGASFLGNAPTMGAGVFDSAAAGFTVYYFNGKSGFTSPTWNGYPAVNMGAATPLATWLVTHGSPYNANLQADPNGDGVSLLMAYALNLDPNRNLSASLPQPVFNGTQMSLTFYAGGDGVTYSVEASTDLQTWSAAEVLLTAPDGNKNRTATVAVGGSSRFLRLVAHY